MDWHVNDWNGITAKLFFYKHIRNVNYNLNRDRKGTKSAVIMYSLNVVSWEGGQKSTKYSGQHIAPSH